MPKSRGLHLPRRALLRRPDDGLTERWQGQGWASPRVRAHLFAPLPHGTYPGVDDRELFEFLETQAHD